MSDKKPQRYDCYDEEADIDVDGNGCRRDDAGQWCDWEEVEPLITELEKLRAYKKKHALHVSSLENEIRALYLEIREGIR